MSHPKKKLRIKADDVIIPGTMLDGAGVVVFAFPAGLAKKKKAAPPQTLDSLPDGHVDPTDGQPADDVDPDTLSDAKPGEEGHDADTPAGGDQGGDSGDGQGDGPQVPEPLYKNPKDDPRVKLKEKLGSDGLPKLTAKEQQLRDTHRKITEHLTRRAMSGHWGPAEDGLQQTHQHLTHILEQHEAGRHQQLQQAKQDADGEASQAHSIASAEANAKAQHEAQQAHDAAEAEKKRPKLRPAEKLAIEARRKKMAEQGDAPPTDPKAKQLDKAKKHAASVKGPPSVIAASGSKAGVPFPVESPDKDPKPGDAAPGDSEHGGDEHGQGAAPDAAGGKGGKLDHDRMPMGKPQNGNVKDAAKDAAQNPQKGGVIPNGKNAPPQPGGHPVPPKNGPPGQKGGPPFPNGNQGGKGGDTPPPGKGVQPGVKPGAKPDAGSPDASTPNGPPAKPGQPGASGPPAPGKPQQGPPGKPGATPPGPGKPPVAGKPGEAAGNAPDTDPNAPPDANPDASQAPSLDGGQHENTDQSQEPDIDGTGAPTETPLDPVLEEPLSIEEQASAVLPYRVTELEFSPNSLTTRTNTGVDSDALTKAVQEAQSDPADPAGPGENVKAIAKALGRPLTTGEIALVDRKIPGRLAVRPSGMLIKETPGGIWHNPDRFAPPEYIPRTAGVMPGSGPVAAGPEGGDGGEELPGGPSHDPKPVGTVNVNGQKLFVPLSDDGQPLCHQHFTDRRTAELVGLAIAKKVVAARLHFDRPKREWVLFRHSPVRGWVEESRMPEEDEGKAERRFRLALEAGLSKAGVDHGLPPEAVPSAKHTVTNTRVGDQVLYHASDPTGSPVGEMYQDRRTAGVQADALSRGLSETRLRHDGDKWVIEKAGDGGWNQHSSYPDEDGLKAEKKFRKLLRKDIRKDEENPTDAGDEASGGDLDDEYSKGFKNAKKVVGGAREVAAPILRHASGVVSGAYSKLKNKFGDQAARAIAASGFNHASGGGKADFSADFAKGDDLDPNGQWITVKGTHCHTTAKGGMDAGPDAVRKSGGRGGSASPGKRLGDHIGSAASAIGKTASKVWGALTGRGDSSAGKLSPEEIKGRMDKVKRDPHTGMTDDEAKKHLVEWHHDAKKHDKTYAKVKAGQTVSDSDIKDALNHFSSMGKGSGVTSESIHGAKNAQAQRVAPKAVKKMGDVFASADKKTAVLKSVLAGRQSSGREEGGDADGGDGKQGIAPKGKKGGRLAMIAAVAAAASRHVFKGHTEHVHDHFHESHGGRGGGGHGGKGGKGGKGGAGGGGQYAFNKATMVSSADFLKKIQTGPGVDTTGHGNTAVDRGGTWGAAFSVETVTFADARPRLSMHHVKSLGRIFMEEVRAGMTKAALTRPDLHVAQSRHNPEKAESGHGGVKFSNGRHFSLAPRVRTAPGSMPEKAAQNLVHKLESILPEMLLNHASVQHIEMFGSQAGTQARADQTQGDGVTGVRGFYDRERSLMVCSVIGNDCHNFYHELAHALDHLLTADDWDKVEAEWGGRRPENFASAFADLCMALRAGHGATREFVRRRPAVAAIMHRYDVVNYSHFSARPDTRTVAALSESRALLNTLSGLATCGCQYRTGRTIAGVEVAKSVARFAAAVTAGANPVTFAAAVNEYAAAAASLLDAADDVLYSANDGGVPAEFSDLFARAAGGLPDAAIAAVFAVIPGLNPVARSRELAAVIAFGWQDQVRDGQGRWSEAGGAAAARSRIEATPDRDSLPSRESLPPIPPPPHADNAAEVAAWVSAVANHPYVKEAERLVTDAKDHGATTGNLYWDPDAAGGTGDFTPARKEIHAEISAHILNSEAAAQPGEKPQVALVIGPPGSGKTSMGRPAARAAMGLPAERTTTLDPDEVKMSLPEYKGWNAALVHDESAEVFDRILEKAVQDRHHIVFDTTGRDYDFMKQMTDKFAKAGYDVHLVHTHLSGPQSAKRAVDRFIQTAFSDNPNPERRGRYVPVGFIAKSIDGNPDRVYQKLSGDPSIASWVSYDADNLSSGVIRDSGRRDATATTSAASKAA